VILQAIAAQPQNAGLYSARAQTHIQLEDWLSAAEDACKAAEIDPRNAKAQLRKGCALGMHAPLPILAASMHA
jgi:Flp pilus assembly protein TadD